MTWLLLLRSNKVLLFILVFFLIFYALISFGNHLFFRTYALDLGLYTNALYDYAHFQWNDSTTFKPATENLLADHFDLYLPVFSLLSYFFGSWTLLIVQLLAALIGGLGVYRFFKDQKIVAYCALVFFLSFFGVVSAFSFDYHSSVVASLLLPWLFVFAKNSQWRNTALMTLVLLISKESFGLFLFFILTGLAWIYRKDRTGRWVLSILAIGSLVYVIAVIKWVIPMISSEGSYEHFDYSHLGNSPGEALKFLLTHPLEGVRLAMSNFLEEPIAYGIKRRLMEYLFYSGFLILFLRPVYIWMLLPIFGQKLFHDAFPIWGVGFHYCIEFAPILAIGIFTVVNQIRNERFKHMVLSSVVSLGILVSIDRMNEPYIYENLEQINPFILSRYSKNYSTNEVDKAINQVPHDARVSCQSPLVPHLAYRESCYTFPDIQDATYIVLLPSDNIYPLNPETYQAQVDRFSTDPSWKIITKTTSVIVFKRTH